MTVHTNATRIRLLTNIRRARLLPRAGEVVVPVGQEVNPVHVVARAIAASSYQVLRASKILNVPADKITEFLLVKEGASLQRGTPLLRKSEFMKRDKVYRCPVEGTLRQVHDGYLIMEPTGGLIEMRAMIPSRVVSVVPNRGVVLETFGSQIQGVWDSGKDSFGQLRVATDTPVDELIPEDIKLDVHGSILVAGHVSQFETLQQLEELNARGLIVGSIPSRITDVAQSFSFPIFVTDGIGNQAMAAPIFELLVQSNGRQAALFSSQSGPAGHRGEVVISLPSSAGMEQYASSTDTLSIGSQVRVWRVGLDNRIGKVIRIYSQPRKNKLGMHLPGADVRFDDGEINFIPLGNIDLLC